MKTEVDKPEVIKTEIASKPRINSVARAAGILMSIAQSEQGLTVREISELVGIERQTAYHLIHTLTDLKFIVRDGNRKYTLGLNIGVLSEAFQRQFSAPDHVRPLVRQLAAATGETCYAVGWWCGEIVILDVARGHNAVQTAEVSHGQYHDAHARAAGKLLLAYAPKARTTEYLNQKTLAPRTSKTLTTLPLLEKEFQVIKKNGFAIDDEEFRVGVCCLAMPLEGGTAPFAIALSAPAERFRVEKDNYLAELRSILSNA